MPVALGSHTTSPRSLGRFANWPVRRLLDREFSHLLGRHVEATLPGYMQPASYVLLDNVPLSPNGKVDRNRLPPAEPARSDRDRRRDQPHSATEEALAAIWAESLGVAFVGRSDDFFADLGGHSLAAMRVVSRIRDLFEVDLPLRHIFEFPTIEA